jgi:MoxR-like ATPase
MIWDFPIPGAPHNIIFAAGNRQGDRGVTYSMPAPLANRFSHYELDVNLDDWVDWAYKNNNLFICFFGFVLC